jgi:N-acetylglucosaminyldiphosphoundecaprenol N-acetyl-beta-D-mannosaminyltransferase
MNIIQTPKTFPVFNLPIHLLDDYTDWLLKRLEKNQGTHVITLNAEIAILGERETELASVIREAELVIPDGGGIIFYLRLRGQKQQRCPGIELAQNLLQQISKLDKNYTVAFYGGKPGNAEAAAKMWQEKHPNLSILTNHGYLSTEEAQEWQSTLQKQQPRLIFVGLGVPRQEFWIRDHRFLCPNSIWIGVGGSFDIWSGTKKRAPNWLRDNNLEWLYRLYQEPWRWRRMLALPRFFWRALKF